MGVGFFAFDVPMKTEELELAARRARVIDLFWGDPDAAVVDRIHAGGALAFWQIGSLVEALAAVDAGCAAVIAQGVEAGGHVRGTTPLFTLLRQVVPAVQVPVVAAGGVALVAALNAGAAEARVGTRFLATAESRAHPDYVAALVAATAVDTVYTTVFGEGWPDAPHRVLRTAKERAPAGANDVVGQAAYGDRCWDVVRWSAQPPTVFITGEVVAMAMYAGRGVGTSPMSQPRR